MRERDEAQTTGPWDEADAPDDGRTLVDLGALRLPAIGRNVSDGLAGLARSGVAWVISR